MDEAGTRAVVDTALEAGINLFDTADIYGYPQGGSETLLGRALRGPRLPAATFGLSALAVVILGRWKPWGLAAASVLFGAAMALQFALQALGTQIPYQLFLALPYALTLVVLAGFGGQAASPSALGEPYSRP